MSEVMPTSGSMSLHAGPDVWVRRMGRPGG